MTTRRAFIGTLAAGLLAAPLAVEAQQAAIDYLSLNAKRSAISRPRRRSA